MRELALFAGAGGGILGSILLGWRVVCAVEISAYCREVLLRRQEEGALEPFPIWDDIRTFDGKAWSGVVDIVTAGFPCQPFSLVGRQRGADDERNMWPDTIRVIRDVRPRWCLLENVPGLVSSGYFGTVLGDLAACGYDTRWDCISAAAVGTHFDGTRLWIVAAHSSPHGGRWKRRVQPGAWAFSMDEFERLVGQEVQLSIPAGAHMRLSDGVPYRVERIRSIGNGQVPQQMAIAWHLLAEELA